MYVYKSVAKSWVTNAHHGSRSPAGPRRLGTATRISASLFRRLSAFFGSTPDQAPKAAKLAVLIPGPGMLVNVRNAPRVVIPPPSETPPVSACKPLYAIFLRKASVYPLSPVKANVGRLCEKLKNAIGSDLEQRCGGNFWRYLRERYWTKSRTLQEGFSGGEGRSILVQDKGPQSQAPAARPQSPAVRGFPRF